MKEVVFDFDGTLTKNDKGLWKNIWRYLGYYTGENSLYKDLYSLFLAKEITYQDWCDVTNKWFKERGLTEEEILVLGDEIKLKDGAEQTFKTLKENGCSLHIVSGNLENVILQTLGDNVKYFDSIQANVPKFDENGIISQIDGTDFDYWGKATFITKLCKKDNVEPKDCVFVGNGNNDEWAYLSGCNTICITPNKHTDINNKVKWNKVIENVDNLTQIIPEIIGKENSIDCM